MIFLAVFANDYMFQVTTALCADYAGLRLVYRNMICLAFMTPFEICVRAHTVENKLCKFLNICFVCCIIYTCKKLHRRLFFVHILFIYFIYILFSKIRDKIRAHVDIK